MTTPAPDWDVLVCATNEEAESYHFFPAVTVVAQNGYLLPLEGLRFRNAYVTSAAIEHGSAGLFHHLYFNALIDGGKVLHVSDYQEDS